ncbi:MAG: SusD/RagB family nutrient-binding outer membrane lipoprotein, partial [Bacteroidota bacterium]
MKKTMTHKLLFATAVLGLLLASCTKDFTEINTDPNNLPEATPQQLLAPALVNAVTYGMLRNRNFN